MIAQVSSVRYLPHSSLLPELLNKPVREPVVRFKMTRGHVLVHVEYDTDTVVLEVAHDGLDLVEVLAVIESLPGRVRVVSSLR